MISVLCIRLIGCNVFQVWARLMMYKFHCVLSFVFLKASYKFTHIKSQ